LVDRRGKKVMNKSLYVRKNVFSSETLHFAIIDLMCSFIGGLGIALVLSPFDLINIIAGISVGVLLFIYLMAVYFNTCIKVYGCLERREDGTDKDSRNEAFNKAFKKAWFLHVYYEHKK
jgi:hypothetical protein